MQHEVIGKDYSSDGIEKDNCPCYRMERNEKTD
jgi:hypothetical protein